MLKQRRSARSSKKAANLSVDRLNLSQVFEVGLSEATREKEREAWIRNNRVALAAYNEHVEKHGVFSEGLRSF